MRGREMQRRAAPPRPPTPNRDRRTSVPTTFFSKTSRRDKGHAEIVEKETDLPSSGRRRQRSRSRSPIISKLMALAMPSSRDQRNSGPPRRDREREEPRNRTGGLPKGRMRMDDYDEKRVKQAKSPVRQDIRSRSDNGSKKIVAAKLDKVVKKAREERSNYWDKKILEAEEKDPQRWGHSGFKELYHKKADTNAHRRHKSRSNSGSPYRKEDKRSRSRSAELKRRKPMSPSRSRSRSLQRSSKVKKAQRSLSRSLSPRNSSTKKFGVAPIKLKNKGLKASSKPRTNAKVSTQSHSHSVHKTKTRGATTTLIGKKVRRNSRSPSLSSSSFLSLSRSRSRSSSYEPPPVKRKLGGKGGKPVGAEESYSSSSSGDEDVLQLHAKRKNRSSSFSRSESMSGSSSSGSRRKIRRRVSSVSSVSSSVSLSSTSDSDSDISIRAKPKPAKILENKGKSKSTTSAQLTDKSKKIKPKVEKNDTIEQKKTKPELKGTTATLDTSKSKIKEKDVSSNNGTKATGKSADDLERSKEKGVQAKKLKPSVGASSTKEISVPPPAQVAAANEKSGKSVPKKSTKSPSESGETESESESDSDSEPRMTLSERFAKLSQMSTDKRELAKPVLSVNEIDTKMKVVKDFRDPQAPKVVVGSSDNNNGASSSQTKSSRPASPPRYPGSHNKDLSSDDRRQHFERMYQAPPADRSVDWSDPRVRFNYYKEKGCFDERPITFDEYIKWEDWYHKYKQWLEEEGYYQDQGMPPPSKGPHEFRSNMEEPRGPFMQQPPVRLGAAPFAGGTPSAFSHPPRRGLLGSGPLMSRNYDRTLDNRMYPPRPSIARRIGRAPGGSLVVNIHPGSGNFPERRRVDRAPISRQLPQV